MASQEFLASFAVEIDEGGGLPPAGRAGAEPGAGGFGCRFRNCRLSSYWLN